MSDDTTKGAPKQPTQQSGSGVPPQNNLKEQSSSKPKSNSGSSKSASTKPKSKPNLDKFADTLKNRDPSFKSEDHERMKENRQFPQNKQQPKRLQEDNSDDAAKQKVQNTGKSLAKKAAKTGAKAGAGAFGLAAMVQGVSMAVTAAIGALINTFATIVGFIVNAVVAAVATVAAVALGGVTVVVTVVFIVVTVVVVATTAVTSQMAYHQARVADETLVCGTKAKAKRANKAIELDALDAEAEARRKENGDKTYSVMKKAKDASIEQIAGMLGCWDAESSVQPKRYETDYITKNAFDKLDKDGPTAEVLDGSWGSFVAKNSSGLNEPAYLVDGKHYIGVGLGQWTGPRSKKLWDMAKSMNKSMFDIDVQLAYMIGPDTDRLDAYLKASQGKTVDQCASLFLSMWEGVAGDKEGQRVASAVKWATDLKSSKVDDSYADSILSAANASAAATNSSQATKNTKDTRCGNKLGDASDYGDAIDGTGSYPANMKAVFTPDALPAELKKYVFSPASFGLSYGGSGFQENSGQCVDLTETLGGFVWYGKPVAVSGDGIEQAQAWASRTNSSVSKTPKKGAIFSSTGSNSYGHTGIVTHVFADGSIMICEQNYSTLSGFGAGKINTWNFRHVTVAEQKADSFTYCTPKGLKPSFGKS